MDQSRIKPSRWYYSLAALIFLAGCGVFVLVLIRQSKSLSGSLVQILAPGQMELNLTEAGSYTIFYEHESVVGERVYSTGEHLSGLECQLISRATGSGIALSAPPASSGYSIGRRSGRSIFQFHIDQPGAYIFFARYTGGQLEPEVVLALGHEFGRHSFAASAGSLALILGSTGLALAVAVLVAIKRDKSKKRLATGVVNPA
jgi:hypothetical protein